MVERINMHVSVTPDIQRKLRILAAQHGVFQGEALAGLLALAEAVPPVWVARAMAATDTEAGELVLEGQEVSA